MTTIWRQRHISTMPPTKKFKSISIWERTISLRKSSRQVSRLKCRFILLCSVSPPHYSVKRESKESVISFLVGNTINGEGGLLYNCSIKAESSNVYECIPQCRAEYPSRNGIVARKLRMSFLVRATWSSIYELEVFTKTDYATGGKSIFAVIDNRQLIRGHANGDRYSDSFISESRLVQPYECQSQSWQLTQSLSAAVPTTSHRNGTRIYLEKSYIVSEIHVQFLDTAPDTLSRIHVSLALFLVSH